MALFIIIIIAISASYCPKRTISLHYALKKSNLVSNFLNHLQAYHFPKQALSSFAVVHKSTELLNQTFKCD